MDIDLNVIFNDKSPLKLFEISNQLKSGNISNQLAIVCKKFRKVPVNYGVTYNGILPNVCYICGKRQTYICKLRKLSCNHTFHSKCITNWLIENDLRCVVCNERCL
jgi:hypothetical protein